MNLGQLIDQFDLITDTEEGLEQLRNLILSFAVRGRLVDQHPNAEPAQKLLQQIEAKRQNLYEKGEIRKPKNLPKITGDEIPFEIPNNWEWCRFGDIAEMINGDRGKNYPSKDDRVDAGIPFINAGNLKSNEIVIEGSNNYITEERYDLLRSGKVEKKDILYCLRGSLGKMAIVNGIPKGAIASSLLIIRLYLKSQIGYIVNLLKGGFGDYLIKLHDNGTAQPNLSATSLKKFIIPLPPLEEQHRIVQKIETLFSQVDELEQKAQQDRQVDERLQIAVLDDLQRAETPEASRQSWLRLTDHFEQIYRKPEHIDQLKQAILNEAVRGRLVRQSADPNDEPADKLLKRIKEEKQHLYNEGEIRKPKDLDPVCEDEIPYELPEGWVWSRLGELCKVVTKGSSPNWQGVKYTDEEDGILFITSKNVDNYKLIFDDKTFVEKKFNNVESRSILEYGDILTNIVGASIGRTAKFDLNQIANINQAVAIIRLVDKHVFTIDYFIHYLNSETGLDLLFDKRVETARANVSLTSIKELLVPMPPLKEQKRVVQKVEALFKWCDDLKEKLNRSQQTGQRLLEALVNDENR